MSKKHQELFDEEYVDLQEWVELIGSTYFSKLTDLLHNRIKRHEREITKLINEKPNEFDKKLNSEISRRDEDQKLLTKFESFVNRKRQMDLEKTRRMNNV